MTVYERLTNMKNNFILAASRTTSNDMFALWLTRAEDTDKKIEALTNEEASKEIK